MTFKKGDLVRRNRPLSVQPPDSEKWGNTWLGIVLKECPVRGGLASDFNIYWQPVGKIWGEFEETLVLIQKSKK